MQGWRSGSTETSWKISVSRSACSDIPDFIVANRWKSSTGAREDVLDRQVDTMHSRSELTYLQAYKVYSHYIPLHVASVHHSCVLEVIIVCKHIWGNV